MCSSVYTPSDSLFGQSLHAVPGGGTGVGGAGAGGPGGKTAAPEVHVIPFLVLPTELNRLQLVPSHHVQAAQRAFALHSAQQAAAELAVSWCNRSFLSLRHTPRASVCGCCTKAARPPPGC